MRAGVRARRPARRRLLGAVLALLSLSTAAHAAPAATAAPAPGAEPRRPLTVFAAASLTDVLGELAAAYARAGGGPVRFSFASSSVLARQIEAGAPADAFVSADRAWMDYLAARGRLVAATRRDVATNRLALVAPADSTIALAIAPGFPLRAALGGGRLATGDPDGVPAGRYAREALLALGVWASVEDRLVRADDVRAALAFVARGEVPLGIVYATDARADRRVRLVGLFPADSHAPIAYPAAVVAGGAPEAARFLDFLRTPAARAVLTRAGFGVPAP